MASDTTIFSVLVALSFIPPVLFLAWLRNHERHEREPWRAVFGAFVYGGTVGVAVAILLHVLFEFGYHQAGGPFNLEQFGAMFLAAVVIAPIVEELAKALGLGVVRKEIDEVEDGIVYGAALGLGFAATENFVYAVAALAEGGFASALATVIVRVFSSMMLHAAASAIIGFGYGLVRLRGGVTLEVIPHYLLAVILHAGYNYMVSTDAFIGFAAAVILVFVVVGFLRKRLRELDALPHEAGLRDRA